MRKRIRKKRTKEKEKVKTISKPEDPKLLDIRGVCPGSGDCCCRQVKKMPDLLHSEK